MRGQRKIGLARALSKMGYCSRSQAAPLIRSGRVALNGRVVRNPEAPVLLKRDLVRVDGVQIEEQPKIYLALNKPRGVVTTASDEQGRETVYNLLPPGHAWVGPIGRLDKASEGLLLLTNDSEWAARITDPASHVEKTYHVQVNCIADDALLGALLAGRSDGGQHLSAKAARLLREGQKNSWLEIVLDEGKNRHIRRLLAALGVEVLRLVRVAVGPVQLGDLKKGAVRPLSAAEKRHVDAALDRGANV